MVSHISIHNKPVSAKVGVTIKIALVEFSKNQRCYRRIFPHLHMFSPIDDTRSISRQCTHTVSWATVQTNVYLENTITICLWICFGSDI